MWNKNSENTKRGDWAENKVKQWLTSLGINHTHPGFTVYGPDKGDIVVDGIVFDVKTPSLKHMHTSNISAKRRKDVHIDYLIGVDAKGNILGAYSCNKLDPNPTHGYSLIPYDDFDIDLLFEVLDLHIGDYQND